MKQNIYNSYKYAIYKIHTIHRYTIIFSYLNVTIKYIYVI